MVLVAIVTTAWGVLILEEELGKDITGSSDEYLQVWSLTKPSGSTATNSVAGRLIYSLSMLQTGGNDGTAYIRDIPVLDSIDETVRWTMSIY